MNLCTLAMLKQYIAFNPLPNGAPNTASDATLLQLAAAYSQRIRTYTGNQFDSIQRTEIRNGTGQTRMMLRQWPVSAVASLVIGTTSVGQVEANVGASGFYLADCAREGDQRMIWLRNFKFYAGGANVKIVYTAGWAPIAVTGELWNVPAAAPYTVTVTQALGYVGGSIVSYTGGAPFTLVAGNPNVGQYSASPLGVLTFNAGDAGAGITVGYNVIGYPADLSEACVEWVALEWRSRDWTGYNSKTINGESVSFTQGQGSAATVTSGGGGFGMTPNIKGALDLYKATVVPA